MKYLLTVMSLVIVALGGTTYYFHHRDASARLQAEGLTAIADSLTDVAVGLRVRNDSLAAVLDTQMAAASRQKEAEIAQVRATYDTLVREMQGEIAQGQVQITRLADRLSVTMVDQILFPSGEADISPAGLRVLRRVGNVLKSAPDKIIRVEGHTDNVAVGEDLRSTFPTNWELSTARATNVVRFLQDSVGIDPTRLQAVGLSQYHPVANNATARGRSRNRRIEIGLLPMPASEEEH